MKTVELSASKRDVLGSKTASGIRKDNKVPGVLYGGKENIHFVADSLSIEKIVNSPEVAFVNLNVDGNAARAIIREVQFHPVNDRITHLDLLAIHDDKPVHIGIPVKPTGSSKGVLAGGKLIQKMRKVNVKALPKHVPDFIEVDITELQIGNSVKIADLKLDGVELLDAKNNVVLAVKVTRAAAAAEASADASKTDEKAAAPAKK